MLHVGRVLSIPSLSLLALSLLASGCYSQTGRTVQRVDPNAQVDLSGNWNDTDANVIAQVMMRDCLSRPWVAKHKANSQGRDPVIKLYPIRNRTSERINTKFFTKQVEQELLNSGAVQVVAALEEAGDARHERTEQAYHASDATKKEQQQETGTDYLLNGWIVSQNDRVGGESVRAYLVTMEMINAESQRKIWMKTHRIKKRVSQPEYQW